MSFTRASSASAARLCATGSLYLSWGLQWTGRHCLHYSHRAWAAIRYREMLEHVPATCTGWPGVWYRDTFAGMVIAPQAPANC